MQHVGEAGLAPRVQDAVQGATPQIPVDQQGPVTRVGECQSKIRRDERLPLATPRAGDREQRGPRDAVRVHHIESDAAHRFHDRRRTIRRVAVRVGHDAENREPEVRDVFAAMHRAVELVGQEGAASTEQDTEQQAEHDGPRPAHADGTARQRGEINDLHLPRLHRLRNARLLIFRPQLVGDAPRVLDLLRQQLVRGLRRGKLPRGRETARLQVVQHADTRVE